MKLRREFLVMFNTSFHTNNNPGLIPTITDIHGSEYGINRGSFGSWAELILNGHIKIEGEHFIATLQEYKVGRTFIHHFKKD